MWIKFAGSSDIGTEPFIKQFLKTWFEAHASSFCVVVVATPKPGSFPFILLSVYDDP